MATINLEKLAHSYDPNPKSEKDFQLKELNLEWSDGAAYALLGPSGCGKSTLLNIISGLIHPSRGRIVFDGIDVTDFETAKRNIAQVFQFPVVYDTMTVYDNLAFPLRNRGLDQKSVDHRVRKVASMIGMDQELGKRARGLGADQKQKISLGRGMVREDVAAILFDEPLTVIDPQIKWELRTQLKELHRQFGHTMIYVTHDQTEALTFADKVVVMHEGAVVQSGTPQELYERPEHQFVGYFIGSPGMNFLPCSVSGNDVRIFENSLTLLKHYPSLDDGHVHLGFRPEFASLGDAPSGLPVKINRIDDIGTDKIVRATVADVPINVMMSEDETNDVTGERLVIRPEAIHLYHHGKILEGKIS